MDIVEDRSNGIVCASKMRRAQAEVSEAFKVVVRDDIENVFEKGSGCREETTE